MRFLSKERLEQDYAAILQALQEPTRLDVLKTKIKVESLNPKLQQLVKAGKVIKRPKDKWANVYVAAEITRQPVRMVVNGFDEIKVLAVRPKSSKVFVSGSTLGGL